MSAFALGHSRPMHSVPVPINVRCYPNSDIIVRRSEVTLRANNDILHCRKAASHFAGQMASSSQNGNSYPCSEGGMRSRAGYTIPHSIQC
jgi:hypothetical protein